VLRILAAQPNGAATVRVIKRELPNLVKLSADDQAGSITRLNEELWEQQVRNLRSHKNTPGNPFAEGFMELVVRGRWQITDAGRLHLKNKGLI